MKNLSQNLSRWSTAMALHAALLAGMAHAQTSPAGLWQSIDDSSGKPRAQIRISEKNGVFTGVIERSLTPVAPGVTLRCELCTDDRKGQPMLGMEIIRGMRKQPDEALWSGGQILDPDKGKAYNLQLRLQAEGKQLQVRGMVGPFFRNQTWNRLD